MTTKSPEPVQQYRAELTLPHSTLNITSSDLHQIQTQIRAICKAENITPTFGNEASANTLFVWDQASNPLGQITTYDVHPSMSVNTLVGARKEAHRQAA